jgi:hypothetical protein
MRRDATARADIERITDAFRYSDDHRIAHADTDRDADAERAASGCGAPAGRGSHRDDRRRQR